MSTTNYPTLAKLVDDLSSLQSRRVVRDVIDPTTGRTFPSDHSCIPLPWRIATLPVHLF